MAGRWFREQRIIQWPQLENCRTWLHRSVTKFLLIATFRCSKIRCYLHAKRLFGMVSGKMVLLGVIDSFKNLNGLIYCAPE
uniref:Uncharacterized protein n=1 Tax=Anguilla anguilla TaxID=7936 RepID=A0A0E9SR11_ANGAN